MNDQNQEEFQKEVKGSLREPKELKSKEIHWPAKISQPKELPYERGFPCETISQPKGPCCEIEVLLQNKPSSAKSFRSHKPTPGEILLRHTCAISQPKSSFRSCEMSCETLKSQILQLQAFLVKNFAVGKHSLGTRVPFRSPPTPFQIF